MSTRERVLQRVRELRARKFSATNLSPEDQAILDRLTTLHDYRAPYSGTPRGELFIHWFYRDRTQDRLSRCEIFHLNMLRYFNVMDRVEKIHIRCATERGETLAMMQAVKILSEGKASVELKLVPQKSNWEHDTIMEAAEYASSSGKYVYYTHFKGSSRLIDEFIPRQGREKVHPLDVLYWAYIMYEGMFSDEASRHDAIGPISCNRVNREYLLRDLSWSTNPEYQYIGSFQAFDGKALSRAFQRLGLDEPLRRRLIWWGGRYTVEMFLCLVFLESEVYTIAQMGNECTAYRMYTKGFCPSIRRRFQALYTDAKPYTPTRNGKVAVCAVAKDEDPYIEEWIAHYLNLGVDHVYVYDNNDAETDTIRSISANPQVTVIPVRGAPALKAMGYQVGIYTDAYRKYGDLYEWMGFFDIDEFMDIDGMDIPAFLSQPVYAGTSVVHLHWRYYGDNGLVRYEDRPVRERFAEPAPVDVKYSDINNMENRYVKSFVRTGFPEMQLDVHSPRFFGAACRNSVGRFKYASRTVEDIEHGNARVNHYGTKTIEEYIRRRIPNGVTSVNGATGYAVIPATARLDWFFNVNEVTDEKLRVIREMLPNLHYEISKK